MNLSMRVLIAVVAAAGVVGLAGAYLGAAALQDGSPSETAAEPTPGEDTPSPSPTTPVASGTPVPLPGDWKEYTDSLISLRYPPDLTFTDLSGPMPKQGLGERILEFKSSTQPDRSMAISIAPKPEGYTLDEWVEGGTACLPETVRAGELAGERAIYCTNQPENLLESAITFEHQGLIYFITSILPTSDFELIMSSLEL
jgi:hypothetical protein